jgi:hypothetical protein
MWKICGSYFIIGVEYRNPNGKEVFVPGGYRPLLNLPFQATFWTDISNPKDTAEGILALHDHDSHKTGIYYYSTLDDFAYRKISHCTIDLINLYKHFTEPGKNVLVPIWHYKNFDKHRCIISLKRAMSKEEIIKFVKENPICIPCIVVTFNDRTNIDESIPRLCFILKEECTAEMLKIPDYYMDRDEDYDYRYMGDTNTNRGEVPVEVPVESLIGKFVSKLNPPASESPDSGVELPNVTIPKIVQLSGAKRKLSILPGSILSSTPATGTPNGRILLGEFTIDGVYFKLYRNPDGSEYRVFCLPGNGMNGPPELQAASVPEVKKPKPTHRGPRRKKEDRQ